MACVISRRDSQLCPRRQDSLQKKVIAVRPQVDYATVGRVNHRSVVQFHGCAHIEHADAVITDHEPVAADGPQSAAHLRARDLAGRDVEVCSNALGKGSDYLRWSKRRPVRADMFELNTL